jgi:hypothetical protein
MTAALSIDFGNSYTKVGIRTDRNAKSLALRSEADLRYDEDHLCIPTVAARVVVAGREKWLYGTQVKLGSKSSNVQVFRNWKPRFFHGSEPMLDDLTTHGGGEVDGSDSWGQFTDVQLSSLLKKGALITEMQTEITALLKKRKAASEPTTPDFDYEAIGRGYFKWLRSFVETHCLLLGIGTTGEIPVRITLPSFGGNIAQARVTLETILKDTGWRLAARQPALAEPVANLMGTFSEGRNHVWRDQRPGSRESYSLKPMIGETILYKMIRARALGSSGSLPPVYWIMIADLGGYTTDFAMVGFDLDEVAIEPAGRHNGKKLLSDLSVPIGVSNLDKEVREVMSDANRKSFDMMVADVDGLRIDRFHQEVYQRQRAYKTSQGIIGQDPTEGKNIIKVMRRFAERIAEQAARFLEIEQYTHIDELILTGGGCNIPLVREALREKLKPYQLKNSYIPFAEDEALPHRCQRLERSLVRGATALGGTSVFFDYD